MVKNLQGDLRFKFLEIAHRMRQRLQIIVVEKQSIKESDENGDQITNRKSYKIRLVSCPMQSGREVSWFS